jgi:hypothetical protein
LFPAAEPVAGTRGQEHQSDIHRPHVKHYIFVMQHFYFVAHDFIVIA